MNSEAVKSDSSVIKKPQTPTAPNYDLTLLVCVDGSPETESSIPHAVSIAKALNGRVKLIQVIEASRDAAIPIDPVEWELRRYETQSRLAGIAHRHSSGATMLSFEVLEGRSVEQIVASMRDKERDIAVLSRRDDKQVWHIGEISRKVIDCGVGSILMVPTPGSQPVTPEYTRIIVPLDGSSRAESAIPMAIRIALDQRQELLLVHVMRDFILNPIGPTESLDKDLQQRVNRRVESSAIVYLNNLKSKLVSKGISASTLVLKGKDPRRALCNIIRPNTHELMIMSSHGSSGYGDVPAGDFVSFMLARSSIPVLMVRQPVTNNGSPLFSAMEASGVCLPAVVSQ